MDNFFLFYDISFSFTDNVTRKGKLSSTFITYILCSLLYEIPNN